MQTFTSNLLNRRRNNEIQLNEIRVKFENEEKRKVTRFADRCLRITWPREGESQGNENVRTSVFHVRISLYASECEYVYFTTVNIESSSSLLSSSSSSSSPPPPSSSLSPFNTPQRSKRATQKTLTLL